MNGADSAHCRGRVVAGRYRLEAKLSEGGMGSVWTAQHLTLDCKVALKLLDASIAQDGTAAARFVQEARAAAALRSPHVVQILDHGIDGTTPFIVMELLEGESLAARLARVGRLSPAETARVVTEVSRAVGKAHESGIIHRDIKPDNIFIVSNDDAEVAKVLDFGIAKKSQSPYHTGHAAITQTGAVFGSPFYMSPEQAEGAKDLDHRTDIWSLAVVAYEALLGVRPFQGETLAILFLAICSKPIPVPSQRGPVPAGFDAWFARGTQRNRELRFASIREAASALREVCVPVASSSGGAQAPLDATAAHLDGGVRERVHAPAGPFRRSSRRRWWSLAAGGLFAVGVAAYALARHLAGAQTAPDSERARQETPGPASVSGAPPAVSPGPPAKVDIVPPTPPAEAPPRTRPSDPPARASGTRPPERRVRSGPSTTAAPRTSAPETTSRPKVDLGL
jgi:eukaryotic-like serine/threonine-protein kinase